MSGNKILRGAAVLGIAGLMVKLLGAFFRIPLQALIGDCLLYTSDAADD